MPDDAPHYPGRPPIDAYGNGGFRFADMSHKGSILIVPSGVYAWPIEEFNQVQVRSFDRVFAEAGEIEFVLFGTGPQFALPSRELRDAFAGAAVGLEPMDTGAAARTYNILLAEQRAVAAALIAVEDALKR